MKIDNMKTEYHAHSKFSFFFLRNVRRSFAGNAYNIGVQTKGQNVLSVETLVHLKRSLLYTDIRNY